MPTDILFNRFGIFFWRLQCGATGTGITLYYSIVKCDTYHSCC